MKYFFDTEFIEGPQQIRFPFTDIVIGVTKPTIDLISIGIVTEEGREFYEISKDFNLWEAWNRFQISTPKDNGGICQLTKIKTYWLRENVLKKIWREMFLMQECDYAFLNSYEADDFETELNSGKLDHLFTYKSIKLLLEKFGKSNNEIAEGIKGFIFQTDLDYQIKTQIKTPIEFYAYYADYDWVVFCWLFGKMVDLPNGFPMYGKDLKQFLDEKVAVLPIDFIGYPKANQFEMRLNKIKSLPFYPKQSNEYSAIADARWNQELFKFISEL